MVDRSVVEVFANRVEVAITAQIFPTKGSNELTFYSKGGKANSQKLDIWDLKRIWQDSSDVSQVPDVRSAEGMD